MSGRAWIGAMGPAGPGERAQRWRPAGGSASHTLRRGLLVPGPLRDLNQNNGRWLSSSIFLVAWAHTLFR